MSDRSGRFDPQEPDDEAARRLREVLAAQAASITPSADALASIRQQIRDRRAGSGRGLRGAGGWLRGLQISAAAVATVAVVVVAVVAVRHHAGTPAALPAAPVSSPVAIAPTPTQTAATVAPSAIASSAASMNQVPVFYVDKRKDPQQLLFREITSWPASPQHTFVKDAVSAMLATPPQDPDYTSYWPAGTTLLAANITGDTTAVINLSSQAASGPASEAAISAQQMLYTIMAAAPKITGLQLQINGTAVTSLWGTPLPATIVALPTWQVWGHIWITSPTQDETVASSVKITGEASVPEATLTYQILRDGGVLKSGTLTATAGAPDRGLWSVTVEGLAPGPYTVRAYVVSAKDGSTTFVDDKAFTVN